MRTLVLTCLFALGVLALMGLHPGQPAHAAADPYVIGAVFDITGPGAPLGTPERDTVQMLEQQINARGGVKGHPIKVIILDNASDEAKSVTAVKKLIDEYHVLAIIGPSQTGTTLAAADTVQAAKVPMISCAAGIKIVDPVKPWIFKTAQSDAHAVAKVLEYCQAHKLQKLAILTVANAYGDSGKQQLKAQAAAAKIEIVAEESFGATDTDMTAQILRLRAKAPQAVVCWGTNPGPAIVAKNMKALNFTAPLIMSHGVANRKFLELAGAGAEGVVLPAGKLLIAPTLPMRDPQRKKLLSFSADFAKTYNREADSFGGYAYDALNLVLGAIASVGPDRTKIRDFLEGAQFVGISGVFKFSKADHNGLAKDAFAMVAIQGGKWTLCK